jgi:hypothetical protein
MLRCAVDSARTRFTADQATHLRCGTAATDPNGGPEDRKVLHVHVHQLNRLLRPHGIRVRGSASGGYRVVNILGEGAP